MKKSFFCFVFILLVIGQVFAQDNPFAKLDFIIGEWQGAGNGFGNSKSKIESGFKYVMGGKYIEVINDSKFEPTKKNPEGEHHIDKGFISYDKIRKVIVFRQFNIEGYVNQYVLNEELSNESELVFETEEIENFMPGGKAKWVIKKLSDNKLETKFHVSFPKKDYTCFGTNVLIKK